MRRRIRNMLYSWRFYRLRREDYEKSMEKTFALNLNSLRQVNTILAVMSACFTFFPVVVEKNLPKAGVYLMVSAAAMLMAVYSRHKFHQHQQGRHVGKALIYALIILFYADTMLFGVYIGVWSKPDGFAVNFIGFLICALFLFTNPPVFNLTLTLSAMALCIGSSVLLKEYQNWVFDLVNVLCAGAVSVVFTWHVVMYKLSAALSAGKLEDERNSYFNQSTVDELTQLKNRRDFTQTFQRYLTDYRESDKYLCLAVIDIDYFKLYNDHYGHPAGDECLRAVGGALSSLCEGSGVYAARIGGEEFALLWFIQENAGAVVSQLRQRISDLAIPHGRSKAAPRVTVSAGVYVTPCGASGSARDIYNLADSALYEAKRIGRNCAVIRNADGSTSSIGAGDGTNL